MDVGRRLRRLAFPPGLLTPPLCMQVMPRAESSPRPDLDDSLGMLG